MRMPRQLDPTSRLLSGRTFQRPSGGSVLGRASLLAAEPEPGLEPAPAPAAPQADRPASPGTSSPLRSLLREAGMPAERAARIAARMAFVDMKRSFMEAAERIEGPHGERVRIKVRRAHDPMELFHLRDVVAALLPEREIEMRRSLRAKLLTVFCDTTTGAPREFC